MAGFTLRSMEKFFSWTSQKEATRAEIRYWLSPSVAGRVLATEKIHQATLEAYDPAQRLERVYQIVECTEH